MHIMVFHLPYLEWFKKNGYETHVCARNDYENVDDCKIPYCDKYIDLPFERSPFKPRNLSVLSKLKNIIDLNDYEIIHCHTPMGGVLTRLAARKARECGTKLVYTAHGFHFYKGASITNWAIYYPVERLLARYTDVLITINTEDYSAAKKFKARKVAYVPGIGVDVDKFIIDIRGRLIKRKELGIQDTTLMILSVGELSKRKNHETVIKALSKIHGSSNFVYVICGQGDLDEHLKKVAVNLNVNVRFLGFRNDISEICTAADLFLFPSYQEGLPVALLEAMSARLAVVCSRIRGNTDLIENEKGGYLVKPSDVNGFAYKIDKLLKDAELRRRMGQYNAVKAKKYSKEIVRKGMESLYHQLTTG